MNSAKKSPRPARRSRRDKSPARKRHLAPKASPQYLGQIEALVERFSGQDSAVQDVGTILTEIRKQYDDVRQESERKQSELTQSRKLIAQADLGYAQKQDEFTKLDETVVSLDRQLEDTKETIQEALTNRKVYEHMLLRLKKEQAVLKQKLGKMEQHLSRKHSEFDEKHHKTRVLNQQLQLADDQVQAARQELDAERT